MSAEVYASEGCLSGHHWRGGVCWLCGAQLRCGACGRFISIETLDRHLDEQCPVKWVEFEGAAA